MHQISTKQTRRIVLVAVIWIFNALVWLFVTAGIVATLITESNLGQIRVGTMVVDFPSIKTFLQGFGMGLSEASVLIAVLVTLLTALFVGSRDKEPKSSSGSIAIESITAGKNVVVNSSIAAGEDEPTFTTGGTVVYGDMYSPANETTTPVGSRARVAGVREERIQDRNRLLTATRLQLIGLAEQYSVSAKLVTLRQIAKVNNEFLTSKHPYYVLVRSPRTNNNFVTMQLDEDLLSIMGETLNWRLNIDTPASLVDCTMVLEHDVIEEALQRAQRDTKAPIPVVVHVGTWASTRSDFETWVVNYLSQTYDISTESGRYFLKNNRLILVFLGLPSAYISTRDFWEKLAKFWTSSPSSCVIQYETQVALLSRIDEGKIPPLPVDVWMYLRFPFSAPEPKKRS